MDEEKKITNITILCPGFQNFMRGKRWIKNGSCARWNVRIVIDGNNMLFNFCLISV